MEICFYKSLLPSCLWKKPMTNCHHDNCDLKAEWISHLSLVLPWGERSQLKTGLRGKGLGLMTNGGLGRHSSPEGNMGVYFGGAGHGRSNFQRPACQDYHVNWKRVFTQELDHHVPAMIFVIKVIRITTLRTRYKNNSNKLWLVILIPQAVPYKNQTWRVQSLYCTCLTGQE